LQLKNGIILSMNSKHRKTLEAIFADPVRATSTGPTLNRCLPLAAEAWKRHEVRVYVWRSMDFSPISTARIRSRIRMSIGMQK
jgi:hypothetical protein